MGGQVECGEAYCLVVCCPGNGLGSATGERRFLSDQRDLCACKREVFSCVSGKV